MEFLVLFEDNDKIWIIYNMDLAASTPFRDYVLSQPKLEPLTCLADVWKQKAAEINRLGIQGVTPGTSCFVNLKSWGDEYYRLLDLPVGKIYVVLCDYVKWTNRSRKRIDLYSPLFNQSFEWNAVATRMYGMCSTLNSDMILVNSHFCDSHPKIKA